METLVKGQSSLYLTEEVTPGTYVAPSVDSDGIEPNQDGIEFTMSREEIERNTLTDTIESVAPRLGTKNVTGAFALEYKAGATAGAEPRGGKLFKALLGSKRSSSAITTKSSGNTASFLAVEDADISSLKKGDIVLVKKPGAFECRPIAAVDETPGAAGILLAFDLGSTPPASVVIEAFTTYLHSSDERSLSATWYPGGEIEEQVSGLNVASASLEGWSANGTPSWSFSLQGLDLQKSVGQPSVAVNFGSDAEVPVMQGALAYLGSEPIDYIELGLSVENTISTLPAANKMTGKLGSRKNRLAVTGSINPYMSATDVSRWDSFNNGDTTSLFAYAYNPTGTAGEFNEVIALWLPNIKITNMPAGDQDGVLTDNIEFRAFRNEGGDSLFLGFI